MQSAAIANTAQHTVQNYPRHCAPVSILALAHGVEAVLAMMTNEQKQIQTQTLP